MKLAGCRQSEEMLVQRDADRDAVLQASMQQHVQSCPACRHHQRTWALVRERALAADDVLDDLTRARVLGRVQARLGVLGAAADGASRRTRPMRIRVAWSLAFAAVAILAFVLGTRLREAQPGLAVAPVVLEPYALHVATSPRAPVPGKALDHLELPAHAAMRARLGPAADLTLLGPLELTVRDSEKPRVELELGRGTLLADFDGSGGRSLRIETPDAIVDIVGTRFIVDASGVRTRVAVDHGLVRVESQGRQRMVGPGRSWSTDEDAVEPLDERTARLFDRAARGQWEELASEPPPKDVKAETSAEGSGKGEGTTGRGTVVSRSERPQRTAPGQRRVHVRRPRPLLDGDADRATEVERRASRTRVGADAGSSGSLGSLGSLGRLALVATPQPAPRTAPQIPTPPAGDAAPVGTPSPGVAPPAPSPVPVPAAPRTARATAVSLYKEAEQALRRGDDVAGKERLVALVRAFPHDVLGDSARFELALLANKNGDQREALAQIREIVGRGTGGPFVEPALFLRCRVYLAEDRDAAETCLVRFVRTYPRSPHDEGALRALIELARAKGQCSKASQLAETYLRRHPKGGFAPEAARTGSACGQ